MQRVECLKEFIISIHAEFMEVLIDVIKVSLALKELFCISSNVCKESSSGIDLLKPQVSQDLFMPLS